MVPKSVTNSSENNFRYPLFLSFFSRRKVWIILFLIIAAAACLRIYNLGKQSLWLDETLSVYATGKSHNVGEGIFMLMKFYLRRGTSPLYYFFLYCWMNFLGNTEFSLRFLSAIFGILLVFAIFFVGRHLEDARTGLYASLLAALSPNHIYYSQEVRPYSLFAFLGLASFFFLYLSLKRNKIIYWIIYAAATILCFSTHQYAVFLFASELIFGMLYLFYLRSSAWKFIAAQLFILCGAMVKIWMIYAQARGPSLAPWIKHPRADMLWGSFLHFSLLSWRVPVTKLFSLIIAIAVPFFLLLLAIGFIASVKNWRIAKPEQKGKSIFLLTYAFGPMLMAFFASYWIPVYVPGRYDTVVLPGFLLLFALGLRKLQIRVLRRIVLSIIMVSLGVSLFHYYFIYTKSNDRAVAEYVQKRINREDIVIATELSITPFEYYWKQDFPPSLYQFPEGPRGFLRPQALHGQEEYCSLEVEKIMQKIHNSLKPDRQLWILYQHFKFNQKLIERLQKELHKIGEKTFVPGDNLNQIQSIYIFKKNSS